MGALVQNIFEPQPSYSYSDIGLIPRRRSTIFSRKDVDTSTDFFGIKLKLPVLVSPMDKVTGVDMAVAIRELGGVAILPRSKNLSTDVQLMKDVRTWQVRLALGSEVIMAIPATGDFLKRIQCLYEEYGVVHFCLDVANSFSEVVTGAMAAINQLTYRNKLVIITGNVASAEGYKDAALANVDAVRVGLGNGSVCSTSVATGVGIGQASAIRECVTTDLAGIKQVPQIIADGGIKGAGDIVKALALGADFIMSGSLFVGCKESPSAVVLHNGKKYKHYAGQASMVIKGKDEFVEGGDILVPYKGSVTKLWKTLDQGIRSGMSYMDCSKMEDLIGLPQYNFVHLAHGAQRERGIHAGE